MDYKVCIDYDGAAGAGNIVEATSQVGKVYLAGPIALMNPNNYKDYAYIPHT